MSEIGVKSCFEKPLNPYSVEELLYNTYRTNCWNPDYENISVQKRLKFINDVVKNVIKKPNIAKNDPTYEKIFLSCMKSLKKQYKGNPENSERFCQKYTKEILKLDKKYAPLVNMAIFKTDEFLKLADNDRNPAQKNILNIGENASPELLIYKTIKPDTKILNEVRKITVNDAYTKFV